MARQSAADSKAKLKFIGRKKAGKRLSSDMKDEKWEDPPARLPTKEEIRNRKYAILSGYVPAGGKPFPIKFRAGIKLDASQVIDRRRMNEGRKLTGSRSSAPRPTSKWIDWQTPNDAQNRKRDATTGKPRLRTVAEMARIKAARKRLIRSVPES